jgi:subtilisin family serine protease
LENQYYYFDMKRLIPVVVLFLLVSLTPAWALYETEIESTKSSQAIIGLAEAHAMGFTGKGQTIVVIDTGVQIDHPYIKDALISGYCSSRAACGSNYDKSSIAAGASIKIDGLNIPIDSHGSMASGIAVGRANQNIPGGVAPGANLISINNTDGQGEGIVKAIDWVLSVKDKFNIVAISASIGAPNQGLRNQPGFCAAEKEIAIGIKKLAEANIAFVAASGNDGFSNNMTFPACLPEAISVGAVDYKGVITNYSNIAQSINVLAPADVIGANASSGYWIGGGTSSATPVVAGAIAILKEVKPSASLSEIRQALATTTNLTNDFMWKNLPILNIPAAIKALKSGEYSKVKVSGTVENVDSTKSDLADALAREKVLNDRIAALNSKLSESENLRLRSALDLSEHNLATTKLQNETKANLELIASLQVELDAAHRAIAKLESAAKTSTITCTKGKLTKKITAINPKCPTGYKKKV